MARINGADARLIIRPERTFGTLPVVLVDDCETAWTQGTANTTVTADAMQGDRERFIAEGFAEFISKPISPRAVLEVVNRFMTQ